MDPFGTVNLPDIDVKLSFFDHGHTAQASFNQLIDVGDSIETNTIVCNVAQCARISNLGVLCEQMEGFSIFGT